MTRDLLLVAWCLLLTGCCWMAKRDCFPACPPIPPARVVKVEMPCQLPPKTKLPAVTRQVADCPADWACYNTENAAKLAQRMATMRDWILETRRRCEPAPSSQPTDSQ